MRISDWSSDVCSSDLQKAQRNGTALTYTHRASRFFASVRPHSPRARLRRSSLLPNPQRSEEHTSELQSLMRISYAVFCLKKKKKHKQLTTISRHKYTTKVANDAKSN